MIPIIVPIGLLVSFINYLYTSKQYNQLKKEIDKIKTDYRAEIKEALEDEINELYNKELMSINYSRVSNKHLWYKV